MRRVRLLDPQWGRHGTTAVLVPPGTEAVVTRRHTEHRDLVVLVVDEPGAPLDLTWLGGVPSINVEDLEPVR